MPHKKKPSIAIMIAVKPSKKDDKKKYVGDAMPNAMNKAWDVLKIQDWRADNSRQTSLSEFDPNMKHIKSNPNMFQQRPTAFMTGPNWAGTQSPFQNRRGNYAPQQGDAFFPAVPPQQGGGSAPTNPHDLITEQRNNPMAQVNPNVPKHFQQNNQSPNQPPPPPNMDPSWTPEAIARINAENDVARRGLRGGE